MNNSTVYTNTLDEPVEINSNTETNALTAHNSSVQGTASGQDLGERGSPLRRCNSAPLAQDTDIETFQDSLAAPIQQPLLHTPIAQTMLISNTTVHHSPPQISTQRKSIRLAKKAEINIGKDTIQIAQGPLVKKLRDLSGEVTDQEETDFDVYAQHFERPIEKNKMEATIKVLIE